MATLDIRTPKQFCEHPFRCELWATTIPRTSFSTSVCHHASLRQFTLHAHSCRTSANHVLESPQCPLVSHIARRHSTARPILRDEPLAGSVTVFSSLSQPNSSQPALNSRMRQGYALSPQTNVFARRERENESWPPSVSETPHRNLPHFQLTTFFGWLLPTPHFLMPPS